MAGARLKYRHLSRDSEHRKALLRNLVSALVEHDHIVTTWHKAKEAQRIAERLITYAKRNTNASRSLAQAILMTPFSPLNGLNKVFGELRERYLSRPGGYTRVLRVEPRNNNNDQAETAILEFVDGKRDMRFAMTAKTIVQERALMAERAERVNQRQADKIEETEATGVVSPPGEPNPHQNIIRPSTAKNIIKVTRYRKDGEAELEKEVYKIERVEAERLRKLDLSEGKDDDQANEAFDLDTEKARQWMTPREGWQTIDKFERDRRRLRKVGHSIEDTKRKHEWRQRFK